ncbi:MAG: hypothetical protein V2I47_03170 [Bacteroidales bacterium]|nr:hypothetical protein [Bacteroidales bacterium]
MNFNPKSDFIKKLLGLFLGLAVVIILVTASILSACKKDESDDPDTPQPTVYVYDAVRSWCDPIIISVKANQKVTITTTDSVITNINGMVEDCDYWTDANGIADCHYVDQNPDLHGIAFMALIGKFDDQFFLVGTYYQNTFTKSGNLELSVNDWGGCGNESDNAGQFVISVLIE